MGVCILKIVIMVCLLLKKNSKLLSSLAKLKNTTLNVLPLSPRVTLMYVLKH